MALMLTGIVTFIRARSTQEYRSVNKSIGEYVVQANDGILAADTREKMEKSLQDAKATSKSSR